MGIYEELLRDIVDAWMLKDIRMTLRKLKKAAEFFEKLNHLKGVRKIEKKEAPENVQTRGEQKKD